jgi:trimethylamine:corrinoid methyltransferase-like protein
LDAQTGLESGMGSLLAGIKGINMISGAGMLKTLISDQQLLDHEHTLRWFRTEHFLPSQVIDRSNFDDWYRSGKTSIGQRALARVNELIERYPGISLDPVIHKELTRIAREDAERFGLSRLPEQESP